MKEKSKQERKENNVILLERRQINKDKPAIAQLHIEFPHDIPIEQYFEEKYYQFPLDADVHELIVDNNKAVIEIQSKKLMYSWFEFFCNHFIQDFQKQGYAIETRGAWDKFENR